MGWVKLQVLKLCNNERVMWALLASVFNSDTDKAFLKEEI